MGQLGLESLDRRPRLLKQLLRLLPRRDLLAQGLPCGVQLVCAGAIIMVDKGDRNLAITNEVVATVGL
jgi:hypothetical protein